MEPPEKISFAAPEKFVPDDTQLNILQAVADKQGCRINHVVDALRPTYGENTVRSNVRILLSKQYLDGGKSSSEVVLRLTSRGRMQLQPNKKS
jgi:hypothetical protein